MQDLFEKPINTPLVELQSALLQVKDIRLFIKRDDLIHPFVSGNKWRKLKYNFSYALENSFERIATFGGAYSNHIYSCAAAAKYHNLECIGFVRGEENLLLNPTLSFAQDQGMILHYISRSDYREKGHQQFQQRLLENYPNTYVIPEGGTNELAVRGVAELVDEIGIDYEYLCCACGTGGTIAGIAEGNKSGKVLGFPVLKGAHFLNQDITKYTSKPFELQMDYHFGGYAKINIELLQFMDSFKSEFNIVLDPVYTAKMMYGIFDMISKDQFEKGSKIIAIHTGGLQGLAGMASKIDRLRQT